MSCDRTRGQSIGFPNEGGTKKWQHWKCCQNTVIEYDTVIGSCIRRITDQRSKYAYEYAGLRLFHVSGDRIFLVPRNWSPGTG